MTDTTVKLLEHFNAQDKINAVVAEYNKLTAKQSTITQEQKKRTEELNDSLKKYARSLIKSKGGVKEFAKSLVSLPKFIRRVNDAVEKTNGIKQFDEGLKQLSSRTRKVGKKLTTNVSKPLFDVAKNMVAAAGEAEGVQQRFDKAFGNSSGNVEDWAKTTSKSVNRSATTLKKAATNFGGIFSASTLGGEATELSKQFAVLGLDLAQAFDLEEPKAFEKLQAALGGDTKALKAFGVNFSDAEVDAQASAATGKKAEDLSKDDKIAARAKLIQQQTANITGAAAEAAGGYENTIVRFNEAMSELSAEFGKHLLPIALSVVEVATKLAIKFGEMDGWVQQLILIFGGFVAVLGPLMSIFGPFLTIFKLLSPIIGALMGPLAPLIFGILALFIAFKLISLGIKKLREKFKVVDDIFIKLTDGIKRFGRIFGIGKKDELAEEREFQEERGKQIERGGVGELPIGTNVDGPITGLFDDIAQDKSLLQLPSSNSLPTLSSLEHTSQTTQTANTNMTCDVDIHINGAQSPIKIGAEVKSCLKDLFADCASPVSASGKG